jgi:hypothetical protein
VHGEERHTTTGSIFLLVFVLIAVRRVTAGLMGDLSVGARIGPVLLRRLLYDESLTGRG